ncbi:MAG: FliI/YscN family ATPase [Pseudomonadota bacterium]
MALEAAVKGLTAQVDALKAARDVGRVTDVTGGILHITGLSRQARIGNRLEIARPAHDPLMAEIVQLWGDTILALPDAAPEGVGISDRATLLDTSDLAPCDTWVGRVIDPLGHPLDGRKLLRGPHICALRRAPPDAAKRRALGARLNTGLAVTNTLLPLVAGQRVGLFAGSGIGKSSLLGHLASHMQADIVVIALIGERGREVRHFVDEVLGPEAMARSVVIAATSDKSALVRRRCAWAAMTVAEHFRDQGKSVLLLADSITRFAEAHREVAVAAGEPPVLRGHPPSTSSMIMSLCERAGPGVDGQGDITAIFTVLVAGSDMEEPIADILRGVLDGHIVLSREIAERGRYPAIDVLRSISRSLPTAASPSENALIQQARQLLARYDRNETMIQAGLYTSGNDPELDKAIAAWPELDDFLVAAEHHDPDQSFQQLELLLRRAGSKTRKTAA